MIDDIRPGKRARQFILRDPGDPDEKEAAPVGGLPSATPVDEEKITEEYGPPPETSANIESLSSKGKIMKALPSLATKRVSRKWSFVLLGFALLLVVGAAAGSYLILTRYKPAVIPSYVVVKPKPKAPTTVASTLTGLPVDPSVNSRPVTAVMIENSIDARPQSGLDQAGIVFEALAEGGVTRFMALYQDSQPDYLGPVRSARPYYIEWLLGFDAAYAHVGGSPDALADITSWNVKDLNEFYNAGAYERISTRYAPHNVYTSIAQLNQLETAKGFTTSNFTGFVRKKEAPSTTPTATSIDLTFSGYYYDAHFDYDAKTNTYKRSESGAPHMELEKDGSQVQIAPKVVVAMIVPEQNGALDSTGAYYADYAAIGSGQIIVFQDGIATPGTWTKASNTSQIVFTGTDGKPLALDSGQTWISAVTSSSSVTYK